MDKLARYNRWLLAVLGSLLILSLLFGLGFAIAESFRFKGGSNQAYVDVQRRENGSVDGAGTRQKRTQSANFLPPQQLDTAHAKYLIPVGQVNLPRGGNHPLDLSKESSYSSSSFRYRSHSGVFNNFVLIDFATGSRQTLFDKKLAITQWAYLEKEGEEVLLFSGTKKDHNKDGRLDQTDYQSLYVFYMSNNKLVEYSFESQTLLSFTPLNKTALVSLVLGLDRDGDHTYEASEEPQEIFLLDIMTRNASPAVSKAMQEGIQNTLNEG